MPLTDLEANNLVASNVLCGLPLTRLRHAAHTNQDVAGLLLRDYVAASGITRAGIEKMPLTTLDVMCCGRLSLVGLPITELYPSSQTEDQDIQGLPLTKLLLGTNNLITDKGIQGNLESVALTFRYAFDLP